MIKIKNLLTLSFAIITTTNVSNILVITTNTNNYANKDQKLRSKRQPSEVNSWDLGEINDNKKETISAKIRDKLDIRADEQLIIDQIDHRSAFATILDSSNDVIIDYEIHFQAKQVTLSSIIRFIMKAKDIKQNDTLHLYFVDSPTQNDIIRKILEIFNNDININEQNLSLADCITDITISSYQNTTTAILQTFGSQERFTIDFMLPRAVNLRDYVNVTYLGFITDNDEKTITSNFYLHNRQLSSEWWQDHIVFCCSETVSSLFTNTIKGSADFIFVENKTNTNEINEKKANKAERLTVNFLIKEEDTITTAPFKEKKHRKPSDDDDKPSSSKRKSDSTLSIYDQPGTSDAKKSKPFTCDNSGTSSTHKAGKNYNLGTIKNNQKDTIINTFIDNDSIKWKNKKTAAASFDFFAINPTYAKIKVTKPIDFVFKSQPITLKANEIINLSFNTADQITVSSIIRILAANNFVLPLFLWTNTYNLSADAIKNERKNGIIDQIFSWLQYLKAENLQLPASLLPLTTNNQILYDEEDITVTNIKEPQNEFTDVIIVLKIKHESEAITLIANEYDIRIFFYDNAIDFIETEDVASNIVKFLKIYFKNLQLQIDQFVDHINKQAKMVVNLGSIIDKSDIHILNALVQYAEKHKIKNSSKMAKLIFKIWTKKPDTNPNIFITANNNNGKIVFPGNKIINIVFTTITKPDFDKANKLIKYNHQTLGTILLDNNNLITKIVKFANSLPTVDGLKLIGYTIWHASTNSRFDHN